MRNERKTFAFFVAVFLAIGFGALAMIYRAYQLPVDAMEPTLRNGDVVIGFRLPYARRIARDLQRFDIAVFRNPQNPKRLEVRRVIGVPRDLFEIRDAKLYINRDLVIEGNAMYDAFRPPPGTAMKVLDSGRDNYAPITIPKREYFVMGDNRDHSIDSRRWGLIPHRLFVARAVGIIAVGGDVPPPLPPR